MEEEDARSLINKGNEFYNVGNYEEARKCYEKVEQLNPENLFLFVYLGNTLFNLAKIKQDKSLLKEASDKYEKVAQLEKNQPWPYVFWGNALYGFAKIKQDESLLEEAFNKYKKATQQKKNNSWPYAVWGDALYDLAKIKQDESLLEEAFDKYEKATQLEPDEPLPYVNWGDTLYDLAKIKQDVSLFEKAFDKYDKATQLDDSNSYVFIKLGIVLINLAEIKQDKDLYEKATENFEKAKKSILEIFVYSDKEEGELIIKTGVLYSLLDLNTEDGEFFNEAVKNIKKGISKEELNKYKEIYIRSVFIISQLRTNREYEKSVAHYTKKTTVQEVLFKEEVKFRLNAINYSNDPSEGKTLLDFLYGKNKYKTDEKLNTEYEAFAGCFTFNYDSLNLFRLYGKEGDKEGTGLSLVFKDSFFSTEAKMAYEPSKTNLQVMKTDDESPKIDSLVMEDKEDKSSLYRCIYIDPKPGTKQPVVTVGRKEEYLFYREGIEDKFEDYIKKMNEIIESVRKEMKELKEQIKNLDPAIVGRLLLNLRYLVKHVAFKEEQECRMIKILNLTKSEGIETDFKQIYFEYSPEASDHKVSNHIDRIYFGPKSEGFELFKSMLKYNGLLDKIQCEKSENPLA